MLTDEFFIKECIELAKNGNGKVSPNPLVGCVIVKNGNIISSGYHMEFGKAHAEVNALKKISDKEAAGSTLYVNLEPCSIYSKTPPCCDLIISKKIGKVVCGTKDPNPLINGNGIKRLRKAGIEVRVGVLEDECKSLNEKFFKYISTGLPYVTVKIAQTLDAKISSGKKDKNGITSLESQKYVHKLRMEHDAILVGSGTIKTDNPFLTLRHVKGRQPYRIILSSMFDINTKSNVFSDEFADKTIVFVSEKAYKEKITQVKQLINNGVRIYPFKASKNGQFDLKKILKFLGGMGVSSVLVEGGSKIFTQFVLQKMHDSLLVFIAPKIFGKGIESVKSDSIIGLNGIEFKKYSLKMIGDDVLFEVKC